jgi:hypothetical protein
MNLRMPSLIFNDFRILGFKGAMREKKSGEVSLYPDRLKAEFPTPQIVAHGRLEFRL